MKKISLSLLKFYQHYISPLKGATCRFYPSCSQYMAEAIEKHGFMKGFYRGIVRIGKCHPWHPGGYDPVK